MPARVPSRRTMVPHHMGASPTYFSRRGCGRSGRRRVTGWQRGSCGRSRGPGPRAAARRGRVACGPEPVRRIGPRGTRGTGGDVLRHARTAWPRAGGPPPRDVPSRAERWGGPRHRRPAARPTGDYAPTHAPATRHRHPLTRRTGGRAPATDALTRTEPVGGPPPVRGAGPRRTGCAAGGSPTRPPPLPWRGRRARRTAGSPAVRAEARPRSGR